MIRRITHGLKSGFLAHAFSLRQMGKIHSIFQNSFNVIVGDQLLHFGKSLEGVSSFGVALEAGLLLEVKSSLEVESRVKVEADRITIYTRSAVWQFQLDSFQEADCRVPRFGSVEQMLQEALPKLNKLGLEKHTGVIRDERESELLARFLKESKSNAEFQHSFMTHFIGRGIGLTPSGDDMLMGYAMMCQATERFDNWLESLDEEVRKGNTTEVSRSYYQALAHGYGSSQFISLLHAMEDPKLRGWEAAVERIIRYGHTSGWDTLFGIRLFLEKLKREEVKKQENK